CGLGSCYADDHIVGHHTWNYLLTWKDFVDERPPTKPAQPGRVWLPEARILVDDRADTKLYLALNKGGAFKFFREGRLVMSDTQFSLQVRDGGKLKNAVGHLVGPYEYDVQDDQITISGALGWAKQKQMTPLNLMILRVVMLSVGRFFPNLIRKLLQKMLITGKTAAPFRFKRTFHWQGNQWIVSDELTADSWDSVMTAGLGGDQTSIYVVMSRTFQPAQLQPWQDLTSQVRQLTPDQPLKLERQL
ncbi:MAG: hypothetical protein AAGC54_13500, partial [Cyanobacteria bacterium P01_F01_bin.4]